MFRARTQRTTQHIVETIDRFVFIKYKYDSDPIVTLKTSLP